MIVPMKKVSIIVQSKDASPAIEHLRTLGVMHVEHQKVPSGRGVSTLREDIAFVDSAINILSLEEFSKSQARDAAGELVDWRFSAKHIIGSWKRLDQVGEYGRVLKETIRTWEKWGDFDPKTLKELAGKNIYVTLYQIPAKETKRLPPGAIIVEKFFTFKGMVHCAVVSEQTIEMPYKELTPPKLSLGEMRARLEESKHVAEWIREDIRRHVCYIGALSRLKKSFEQELEFREALSGMGASGDIAYLVGFIPYDSTEPLLEVSKKEKWGIVISDPSDEDKIPTLIRNPRWVSIIAPVFKALEIIPGYKELDISFWFLVFFSVFFGMLIGDAGYGLVFFGLTLFAQLKFGKRLKDKSAIVLFYLLSFCAVIWGVLTGTFFGQEWLPHSVKPLIPGLRDSKTIQIFCFFLGALHLSIAHLWRTIVKLPSVKALAEIGWALIIWGAFFLAKMLILGQAFPPFGKWLFITGALLVVFFTNPAKNVLKGIGAGFGNLLLNAVNSFTDVVSYIRLFAVGLATVAIADAFNKMAMGIGFNGVLTGIATSLIIILGHGLNIVLGPLAILVHGVRLNVLEFSNHADVKWSGFSYKPLQK